MNRDYYKILLTGQSGKGKTYSARNLDPETTGFLNVENKPLPFKNHFKHHIRCSSTNDVKVGLKNFADNPDIKVIFFDSFSAYVDMLLLDARKTKRGFDIWNYYNEEIGKMLNYIKDIEKEIFVTAHYEMLNIEGDSEKRVKVKGKEWEGMIEKEFTVVLYADRKHDDKKNVKAWFELALDGSSCKCPPDIFGPEVQQVDNDCKFVVDKIHDFVGA
jgi:hypothetical protein